MAKKLTKEELSQLILKEVNNLKATNKKEIVSESVESDATVEKRERKFTANDIKNLAEEIKKINKNLNIDNPVICSDSESLVDKIISESKREMDVNAWNKSKELYHKGEKEGDKWKRLMDYKIPDDENRK